MIYEIRLSGAEQDDGKIELSRLALLAQSVNDIAKGALLIRLSGFSGDRGKKSERITDALKIRLTDLKKGSTLLELDCETFGQTLAGQQGDVFRAEILEELPSQTPMSLVIVSFREALNYEEEANHLDKGLLKKLKAFEKVFVSSQEKITISNRGSIAELTLKKEDFGKIQTLEESIPDPQEIILNGVLDELKFSKSRVTIITKNGIVNGLLNDNFKPDEISKYWAKELTIAGTAHYQPGGRMSFLLIKKIYDPTEADKYFSKKPIAETLEQQIERQLKEKGYKNQLADVIGKWPGDEEFNDLIQQLNA